MISEDEAQEILGTTADLIGVEEGQDIGSFQETLEERTNA